MKKDFLKKVKGAILSKEESKTISGGYDYTGYECFFVCCPSGTSLSNPVISVNGCNDSRYKYYAPQFFSNYCVKCN